MPDLDTGLSNAFTDGSYLTSQGKTLLGKLLASKGALHFSRATLGSGTVPVGMSPEWMTNLSYYVMDGLIASVDNPKNGEALVVVQALSRGVQVGFNVTEIMLWAVDPDTNADVPYTYLSLSQYPEWIRPETDAVNKIATFNLITVVNTIPMVSATINPSAFARAIDMDKYALIGHKHEISDINELKDWLKGNSDGIDLLFMLLSNSIPSAADFIVSFDGLDNIQIIDGVWAPERRLVWA